MGCEDMKNKLGVTGDSIGVMVMVFVIPYGEYMLHTSLDTIKLRDFI